MTSEPTTAAPARHGEVTYLVSLSPEPDYEEKFNLWYDTIHVPEILACPGFLSACRYRLTGSRGEAPRYLAAYRVESMAAFEGSAYQALHARSLDELESLAREVRAHHTREFTATYVEIFRSDHS